MPNVQIATLRQHIDLIETFKESIVSRWVDDTDVLEVLSFHKIEKDHFKEEYAYSLFEYYIDIVNERQSIGQCPVIIRLLEYFKEKDITKSELYVICIHFRESMIRELFQQKMITEALYNDVSHVFNANFKGVLQTYTDTIFSAKQEVDAFQNIIENSLNEIYITDAKSMKFLYVNKSAIKNLGYSLEELLKMTHQDIGPDLSMDRLEKMKKMLIDQHNQLNFEMVNQRRDGSVYPIKLSIEIMHIFGKESFITIGIDISEHVEALKEKELYYEMATHDHLTGIYNRKKFDMLFNSEAIRAQRYGLQLSLILFDIDDFKRVNDTHGHDIGDKVIVAISRLVQARLRDSDIFARWGGEEFIILLPHTDLMLSMKKAEELRKVIASASIDDIVDVTCSFGVSQLTDFDDVEHVFKASDEALYLAKRNGKNMVETRCE